jgi:DNA-binding NarL/FixJ family response regulator
LKTLPRVKSVVNRTTGFDGLCHDSTVTTVLIVDDHPSFRASARAILEAEGFEVIGEAEDGTSAIDAIERLKPDVVLLDVQLPDMDGFEICADCPERNGWLPTIVLVSSRDAADYGDLITRSGARGFIPKAELSGEALAALVG